MYLAHFTCVAPAYTAFMARQPTAQPAPRLRPNP